MIKEFKDENQAKAIADSLGLLMTKYKGVYIVSNNKEEILARYNLGYNSEENVFYDKEVFEEDEDGYIVIRDRDIVDASSIELPYGIRDCSYMFYYCSFLKIPPNIPEGAIACSYMFENCITLKTPPVLPNSIRYCIDMFYGCTSLEIPPNIPENTADCLGMFQGCSSIKKRPHFPENCDTRDALKDTPFERGQL